jgi:hypothetical protein
VFGAVVAAVALVWWWGTETSETRALRALPGPDRGALYRRTLENLRTICTKTPTGSLREFCNGQAELVLKLPECDEACRALANRYLQAPTR